MTPEEHQKVIDKAKEIADGVSTVAEKAVGSLKFGELFADRKSSRERFISAILKGSDKAFTETATLGREFFEEKFR